MGRPEPRKLALDGAVPHGCAAREGRRQHRRTDDEAERDDECLAESGAQAPHREPDRERRTSQNARDPATRVRHDTIVGGTLVPQAQLEAPSRGSHLHSSSAAPGSVDRSSARIISR